MLDHDGCVVLCAEHHIPMYWDDEAKLYFCWEWQRSGCEETYAGSRNAGND